MQIPKKCVICGNRDVSDTSMNITLHTIKHEVFICSDHEDTSPSQAKIALIRTLDELDKLIEAAAEFGYELIEKHELATLKERKPAMAPTPKKVVQEKDVKIVSGSGKEVTPQIVGGDADATAYAGVSLDNNQNEAISEIARSEKKISAPDANTRVINDMTGETVITIQGIDDRELQKIAKMEEQASAQGRTLKRRNCNLCQGKGIAPNNKAQQCPKCKGSGVIIFA